jgi:hypothetical protein
VIAFSSDFLEKIIYQYDNGGIEGFTNSTLLYFYDEDTNKTCRYFSSRNYIKKTNYSFRLLAFKLTFVIIYQVSYKNKVIF